MIEELKHTKQQQNKLINKLKIKVSGRRFIDQLETEGQSTQNKGTYFNIRGARTTQAQDH